MIDEPINVMVHICDAGEKWVFMFTDDQMGSTLHVLAKYAYADDLSFSVADAEACGEKMFETPERFTLPQFDG